MLARPLLLAFVASCGLAASLAAAQGDLPDAVVLTNEAGLSATILQTGACIQKLVLPDGTDVMMGFANRTLYENGTSPTGCLVGRVGGKISGGEFTLEGVTYKLESKGDPPYTMHGGGVGYSRLNWTVVEADPQCTEPWVELELFSYDGEQGFPGNLTVTVTYKLTQDNELVIDIRATTDKATPINVFNHPYFNLAGLVTGNETILDHVLTLNADYVVELNSTGSPTGQFVPVAGSPLDFNEPHAIGERIEELANTTGGYAHTYLLKPLTPENAQSVVGSTFQANDPPALAATLVHPASGRGVEISTTTPALVLFTANSFKGSFETKGGARPQKYGAVALEATMFSEAMSQPSWPTEILWPDTEYRSKTVWRFFQQEPASA